MIRTARIIVLSEPVTNPHPDGRKRDWSGAKQFQPGRYVDTGTGAYRIENSRYSRVDNLGNKDGYQAIVAAATEVAPHGIKELLITMGGSDWDTQILGVLLQNNLIAETQIQSAIEQLDANEDLWDQV